MKFHDMVKNINLSSFEGLESYIVRINPISFIWEEEIGLHSMWALVS